MIKWTQYSTKKKMVQNSLGQASIQNESKEIKVVDSKRNLTLAKKQEKTNSKKKKKKKITEKSEK